MPHPDEGTIQSLLDGELPADERARLELHFRSCADCAARLAEAREFHQEADRLVEMVVVPQPPARSRGRRTPVRTLAWAASIVVAVAAGYWGRGTTSTTPPATSIAPPAAQPPAQAKEADAGRVASGEARDAAPKPEPKVVDRVVAVPQAPPAAAEREAPAARANAAAAADSRLADEAVTEWHVGSMEEAVRVLGGQIRLIDGLAPNRIELGPGTAVPGADPDLRVVRVVYAGGGVMLDQQRPAPALGARKEAAASGAVAQRPAPGWEQRGDIRFVVTGSVSVDSLRALGARVR